MINRGKNGKLVCYTTFTHVLYYHGKCLHVCNNTVPIGQIVFSEVFIHLLSLLDNVVIHVHDIVSVHHTHYMVT